MHPSLIIVRKRQLEVSHNPFYGHISVLLLLEQLEYGWTDVICHLNIVLSPPPLAL